jgi:hypothetical protein
MGRAFEYRKERKMKRWGAMAKAFTRIGKISLLQLKKEERILILTSVYVRRFRTQRVPICQKIVWRMQLKRLHRKMQKTLKR